MKLRNKFRDYLSGQLTGHTDNFETSQNNIITSLRQGYSLADSIETFGYDESKIKRWYYEGSKGVSDYYNFYMVCDSFVADEIKNHDLNVIYSKLKDAKSFSSAIGEGNFKSDTYNSPNIIKGWIIAGKNGNEEFRELYDVIRQYTFSDLLDIDIDLISAKIFAGSNNLNFLDSDELYCRRDDFGRWYKNVDHSDERYVKLNENCGDFFKRHSKDQFLYKLNKGFILGESFETDFHRFQDFVNWYIAGSKGNAEDALFYKNVESILIRNYNFNEYNTIISNKLKPDTPFEDALGEVSSIYVDEWIRLGKYGLEPFHSFYQEYLKHDTQFKVIGYLKDGYDFNNQIPDLDYDFETVQGWFDEKGDFYKKCIEIFIDSTNFKDAKTFLTSIVPGVPLTKAIDSSEISRKHIEKWMEYGKQGYSPFSKFYTGLLKTVLLKALSRKLSFDNSLHLLDDYYTFKDFREAYDKDIKFQNQFLKLLVKNTNFDKANALLKDFNLEITPDENLSNSNISYDELQQWINLANNSFKPFRKFNDVYNKYLTQNKIILAIKQGSTFEQAINVDNSIFNEQEIRSWYDAGEGSFYEVCYRLTETESQKLVLSYLNQGLTFENAINQANLLHKSDDIKSWFMLGKNGNEQYVNFYNAVGKTLLLSQLRQGLYLNNAIAASNGLIGMDYVKTKYREDPVFYEELNRLLMGNTFYFKHDEILRYLDSPFPYFVVEWLHLAENGFDPFIVFYEQYKDLVKNIQSTVINSLSSGMSIEEILQLKEVNCSVNVLKSWYDDGANNNPDFHEFYTAVEEYRNKLNVIKKVRDADSPDFKNQSKILATQNFVINNMVAGMSFNEAININYMFFDADTIEKWYFEGLVNKKFAKFSNAIYKLIKDNSSPIMVKSFVLLKMRTGVRFKELANLAGFNSQFSTIQGWYDEGLKGNKEHKVFAEVVKDYDEKMDEWRKVQEHKRLVAEKERQELLRKQKEDAEKRKIEEQKKLEEAKNKMAAEELKKLQDKQKKENQLREQVLSEEKRKADEQKKAGEQKKLQEAAEEKMLEEQRRIAEKKQKELEEKKRMEEEKKLMEQRKQKDLEETKKKLKDKKNKEEDKKRKELKNQEEKHRHDRNERLKRQREEIKKDNLLNEIKN